MLVESDIFARWKGLGFAGWRNRWIRHHERRGQASEANVFGICTEADTATDEVIRVEVENQKMF